MVMIIILGGGCRPGMRGHIVLRGSCRHRGHAVIASGQGSQRGGLAHVTIAGAENTMWTAAVLTVIVNHAVRVRGTAGAVVPGAAGVFEGNASSPTLLEA